MPVTKVASSEPRVGAYMTASPMTIGADQPLAVAHKVMRARRIRHLPVLENGKLVGVVSLGDLHLLETLGNIDQRSISVEEAMTPDLYVVRRSTPVAQVAQEMAERKIGSAIVVERGAVVGVFTTIDALRALVALA
jgi:acetoin utilization protein AcuB